MTEDTPLSLVKSELDRMNRELFFMKSDRAKRNLRVYIKELERLVKLKREEQVP